MPDHTENTPQTGYDLWVLPLEGNRKLVRLLGETFNEWAGVFSPDVHWIAYSSTETARGGIYVRPFLAVGPSGDPAMGQGKWQVSKEAGNWARWVGDEIFFSNIPTGTGQYVAHVKTSGGIFESDAPRPLFTGPATGGIGDWQVSQDGSRFLWAVPQVQQTAQAPINVVLNWPALLKQ